MKNLKKSPYILLLFVLFFYSCSLLNNGTAKNKENDEIFTLRFQTPVYDVSNRFSIALDSVINDSRCPKDVQCVWEGSAKVGFSIQIHETKTQHNFTLETLPSENDTTIGNFNIKLRELSPYPTSNKVLPYYKYEAEIEIKEL